MKIKAAVTRAPHGPQSLETLELEDPRAGEILVRLVATGVCHTDIAMRDQAFPVPQPIVLGHEGAGIVEKVGAGVTKVAAGDHVVMTYNSCGRCDSCLDNEATYCYDFFGRNFAGSRPDGSSALKKDAESIHSNFFGQSSFATYSVCHERNVVKVRKDAPLEKLGPLACGIQTGAGAIINAMKVGVGQSLAIFGTGSVGLSAVLAARLVGAGTIIAIDLNPKRLEVAKELGATHVLDAGKVDVATEVMKITGNGVNFSFETTGNPMVIRQAVDALTLRGMAGLVGASNAGTTVSLDVLNIMTAGRKIRGIVEGDSIPDLFIPKLIDLYMQGRFPFDRMIKFYKLDDINQAIGDSEKGMAIKAVVTMT